MSESSTTPPTPRQALIARGEQLVLVLLALTLVAGIAYRAVDYWRVGADPLEVVPPPDGPTFRINVNAADWPLLSMVPGLGEKTAKKVIALRDSRKGGFKSVDELKDVNGIGAKTLEKIRPYLYAGEPGGQEEPVRMVERP
ncbi:MAG: helix-hairpin-helix domain-containing protein [Planctomycetota bacterium]|nr:helix-hairpin-helix domain-containing protein [Planctomycetota bacterium]